MKELKILTIYPKYLNANGDAGNIMMLSQRAEVNGVEAICSSIDIGEPFSPSDYDFFYIGGTPDEFNPITTTEILKNKELFIQLKETSKTLLGVGFGYQILGTSYTCYDTCEKINCLGLMDLFTIEKNKRHVGNVTSKMDFMSPNFLVGFENHRGSTYLNKGVLPLSYVDKGFGNNGSDKTEGAIYKNIFGTYLTGPLLPRNVYFSDYLLKITMENKYQEIFELVDEENTLEEDVHLDFIDTKY